MKACPYCAEEIQDAAIKCRHCGSMLVPSSEMDPPPATPTSNASPSREQQAAKQIARYVAALLGTAIVGWIVWVAWPISPERRLAENVLRGIKRGELTSIDDLKGTRALISGADKRYRVSVFAKPDDLEFPTSALFGKLNSFRLLSDDQTAVWRVTLDGENEPGSAYKECDYAKERAAAPEQSEGRQPRFGRIWYQNVTDTPKGCRYDWLIGAAKITYTLETDRGFWKMTFITDESSIYAMDLHQ